MSDEIDNMIESMKDVDMDFKAMDMGELTRTSGYMEIIKQPCEDAISRQAVLDVVEREQFKGDAISEIEKLPSVNPQEPKTGHCKDCKWWKDSDGMYRRGVHAESQCPINRREVMEGMGYCFMFEPQESEDKE